MESRRRIFTILRWVAVFASGISLASAFPPAMSGETAWIALVPLLMLCHYSRPREAFGWGFVAGLVFWLISISWLLRMSHAGGPIVLVVLAWFLLSAYCAVYTAGFAMAASYLFRLCGMRTIDQSKESNRRHFPEMMSRILLVISLPMLWVGFEYLRSVLFTGFPWNALGISQFRNLGVIQIAEWGGVYAVSAVIVVLNTALAMMILRFVDSYRIKVRRGIHFDLMTGLLICALCWMYGVRRVKSMEREPNQKTVLTVALIQPNIPQLEKWPDSAWQDIFDRLTEQTQFAAKMAPDLVIWPETAVPGALSDNAVYASPLTVSAISDVTSLGVPLLVGAMEVVGPDDGIIPTDAYADKQLLIKYLSFYNSSFLFDANGDVVEKYRKRHLVPFGEYIPFDKTFKFLQRLVPIGFSCNSGRADTVFRLAIKDGEAGRKERAAAFSVLICFEDIVSSLARKCVRKGARFLVNQTNDAWFDGSFAAVQHMSHCVFRCVENRVPAVRCSNTGVTCFIGKEGKISELKDNSIADKHAAKNRAMSRSSDMQGAGFPGFQISHVYVAEQNMPLTFYTRYGDYPFAVPCSVFALVIVFLAVRRERRGREGNDEENNRLESSRKRDDTNC